MLMFLIGMKLKALGLIIALSGYVNEGVIIYFVGLSLMVLASLNQVNINVLDLGIFFIIYGIVHSAIGYYGYTEGAEIMGWFIIAGIIVAAIGSILVYLETKTYQPG